MTEIKFNDKDVAAHFHTVNYADKLEKIYKPYEGIIHFMDSATRNTEAFKAKDFASLTQTLDEIVPAKSSLVFLKEMKDRFLDRLGHQLDGVSIGQLPLGYQIVIYQQLAQKAERELLAPRPEVENALSNTGNRRTPDETYELFKDSLHTSVRSYEEATCEIVSIADAVDYKTSPIEKFEMAEELRRYALKFHDVTDDTRHQIAELTALSCGLYPNKSNKSWDMFKKALNYFPGETKLMYTQQLLDYEQTYGNGKDNTSITKVIEDRNMLEKKVRADRAFSLGQM